MMLANQKLVKEMRRLLKIFPNGVIIHSNPVPSSSVKLINRNFREKISDIKNRLAKLDEIEVKFNKTDERDSSTSRHLYSEANTTLAKLLKFQARQVEKVDILEKHGVRIKCEGGLGSGTDGGGRREIVERIFSIKTVKVFWEGKSTYMHVFIDTTDIAKLEEANNNIR